MRLFRAQSSSARRNKTTFRPQVDALSQRMLPSDIIPPPVGASQGWLIGTDVSGILLHEIATAECTPSEMCMFSPSSL